MGKNIVVLMIIAVVAYVFLKGCQRATEAENRVEAPYAAAMKEGLKRAYPRDCPKYFESNFIAKITTMRKFSWCDELKNEMK